MPPRKKNDTAAILAAAAAFLASQGKETPDVDKAVEEAGDRNYRSNDAALIFVHYPAGFKYGICRECGRGYGVNRKAVGFCSDPCRRENWVKTTGIPWKSVSTADVWNGEPPLIISPDQFDKLRALADWFNTNRTVLSTRVESHSEEAPELEFLEPHPEDSPDFPTDPQILATALVEEAWLESELSPEPNLPTSPDSEPASSTLELDPEEVSLFEF